MSKKILFDWTDFNKEVLQQSKTEEIVIKEHFGIWLDGHSDYDGCSSPELQSHFEMFKSAWIMSQMFTQ